MYEYIFSYLVNKLEMRLLYLYLSPIEKKLQTNTEEWNTKPNIYYTVSTIPVVITQKHFIPSTIFQ